ncbi:MAG: SAM-dependent methyltransferase, partial [Verrucomicrobiales bacterium]|nr:SAM-dependent methyltransferase [Verrucomicrobiales bacterium]
MNIVEYNRNAWNLQSEEGCRWSTPYPDEVFEKAKSGVWSVSLTPNKSVPANWFPQYPDLTGIKVLALACGGGQQVPIFAA